MEGTVSGKADFIRKRKGRAGGRPLASKKPRKKAVTVVLNSRKPLIPQVKNKNIRIKNNNSLKPSSLAEEPVDPIDDEDEDEAWLEEAFKDPVESKGLDRFAIFSENDSYSDSEDGSDWEKYFEKALPQHLPPERCSTAE